MELILITGLDGSGKSSVFKMLEEHASEKSFDTLLLPQFELAKLEQQPDLLAAATFVNTIGLEADVQKNIHLKAVALFASMLLFNRILRLKEKQGVSKIYCERHPLVDTGVYAHFYAAKLAPRLINYEELQKLDNRFPRELDFVLAQLPKGLVSLEHGKAGALLDLIHRWFHIEKKFGFYQLGELFDLSMPNKIYYLRADAEFLFNRIKNREHLEVHESEQVLRKLGLVYDQLFENIEKVGNVPLEIIDVTKENALEEFYNRIFLPRMDSRMDSTPLAKVKKT